MPIVTQMSEEFNKRFAAWVRIEPRCRQDDFAAGLQASSADALWFLARQFQMGEFAGEDAGSPINVQLEYTSRRIDSVKLGDDGLQPYPNLKPLETLVEEEAEEMSFRDRVRVGQEFERRLGEKLKQAGLESDFPAAIDALRSDWRFPEYGTDVEEYELDRATQRFVRFMAGRVVDGKAVLDAVYPPPGNQPVISGAHPQIVVEVCNDTVQNYYGKLRNCTIPGKPPAWQPQHLDYRFEAVAHMDGIDRPEGRKIRLVAPEYRSGTVDWYTFDAMPSDGDGPFMGPGGKNKSPSFAPTRVRVAGTSPRWWAFEDAKTDFGSMDVSKPDLLKLIMMEFVLIYGDDWFSVPASVDLGSLVRIDELAVFDTFGGKTVVGPARRVYENTHWEQYGQAELSRRPKALPQEARFDLFTISCLGKGGVGLDTRLSTGSEPPYPVLFIPPIAGSGLESPTLDEVRFLRDEGANMVWGVEHIVPNGLGRPVSGFDAQMERIQREREKLISDLELIKREIKYGALADADRLSKENDAKDLENEIACLMPYKSPTPVQGDAIRYRFATLVPENWVPFIPVRKGEIVGARKPAIEFCRAKMIRNLDYGKPEEIPAMSRLLSLEGRPLIWLNEEAVPREGVRVRLTRQRVRWTDGTTHVWLGRKITTGRGEGSSGLKFDILEGGGR